MLLPTEVKNVTLDGKLWRILNKKKVLEGNNCGLFEANVTAIAEGTEKTHEIMIGSQDENRSGYLLYARLDSTVMAALTCSSLF